MLTPRQALMKTFRQQGEIEESTHIAKHKYEERRIDLGDVDPKEIEDKKEESVIKEYAAKLEDAKLTGRDEVQKLEQSFAKFKTETGDKKNMGKPLQDQALEGGGVMDQMIPIDGTWEGNDDAAIDSYQAIHEDANLNQELLQEKEAAAQQPQEMDDGQ